MMTVHVLHAGDGYLYLIRSVAAFDSIRPQDQSLAAYYTANGQPPGRWSGLLAASLMVAGEVTEAQMKSLFGDGAHPNAELVHAAALQSGASEEEAVQAVRLGRRFPVFGRRSNLTSAIGEAYSEQERFLGRPLKNDEKLATRQRVVAEGFTRRTGRAPIDPVELDAESVKVMRSAVAGYDLVFTPVKSVALLWGLGSPEMRRQIYEAHKDAVSDSIAWLERNAAYTRTGTQGQAQIDTTGIMAAVFDHWDSRAGDPDLHTHVAISNKVRGIDDKWRSLDGRAMFAAAVSMSERYNTFIEDQLRSRLGVSFGDRSGTDAARRPVREIAGIPVELIDHFSKRRQSIETQYQDLLREYQAQHGRQPGDQARLKLYQQATLSDRPDKQGARSLQQMVEAWRLEAQGLLGIMDVAADLERRVRRRPHQRSAPGIDELADAVLGVLSTGRSTWNLHHLRAEAHRASRSIITSDRDALVENIVAGATDPSRSIRIEPARVFAEPVELRRRDGESVFVEHASARFTTKSLLDAEERIVAAARERRAPVIARDRVQAAIDGSVADGRSLNAGQAALVRAFCLSGRRVQLGLAPAGAGKTTAMRAVSQAWADAGGTVVALAPSAAAADVLSTELSVEADTIAKFDHDEPEIARATMILVDEAGMTGTLILDRLVQRARATGAVVRLIGDDQQLGAVEAGGVIRQIAHDVGAVRMQQLVRFADPAEAQATLRVREGKPDAVDFYLAHERVIAGTTETVPSAAYDGWLADLRAGRDVLLLAPSSAQVSELNARARADLVLAGQVGTDGAALRDGNVAGVGDRITTRRNDRLLAVHAGRDWVKNGDSWRVEHIHDDGALTATHRRHHGRVTLPADYVASQVELDYARTIRRSQGLTVDRTHLMVDPGMAREDLYVGLSRARQSTQLYVAIMTEPGPDHPRDVAGSAADVLRQIVTRSGAELSAGETVRAAVASLGDLRRMAVEYEHAIGVQVGDRFAIAAEQVRPGITADVAWPSVVQRLRLAEAAGWSALDILQRAERMRPWIDARSDTEVMAYRLEILLDRDRRQQPERPVPLWLAAAPPAALHPPWNTYLPQRYAEMSDRISTLVVGAEAERPTWLAAIGTGEARPHALREVVAYRAVYAITVDDPLGPEPAGQTRQHHAWFKATQAIRDASRSQQPEGVGRLLSQLEDVSATADDFRSTIDPHAQTRRL